MRFAVWLFCALALSACVGDLPGLTPGGQPQAQRALARGVAIGGPEGYCVDRRATRPGAGFVLLAACGVLGGETFPRLPAVLTAQVGEAGTASVAGSEPAFAALLATAKGASAIATEGVAITDIQQAGNRVSVELRSPEEAVRTGLQTREWRVFTDVGDRLVTLSVRGLAAEPLDRSEGNRLLLQFLTSVQRANAAATGT